jgi:hypothetical protein
MKLTIASIVIGAVLGIIGSKYLLVGSSLSLIPWGIINILIGWFSQTNKWAIINGVAYGFSLCFMFMLAGYSGADPVVTKIPFFILIGLFGALCGHTIACVSRFIRTKIQPFPPSHTV